MDPYLVDVSSMLQELAAEIDIEGEIETGDLVSGDTEFRARGEAQLIGSLVNGGDGVLLSGSVTAVFMTECTRCLEEFALTIGGVLEGLYTTPEKARELPDDQDWEALGRGTIDIGPAIEAALRVELPFAPAHDQSRGEICELGETVLREGNEASGDPEPESGPFEVLKGLFPSEPDGSE